MTSQTTASHWPGARLGATLLLPTTDVGGAVSTDRTVFVHGGYAVHPLPSEDARLLASPALQLHAGFYARASAHDDLWSIDVAANCIDSAAPGANECVSRSPLRPSLSSLMPAGGEGVSLAYDEVTLVALSESRGNTCPDDSAATCGAGGECMPAGGSYYCNCHAFAFGSRCNTSLEVELRTRFEASYGTVFGSIIAPNSWPFTSVALRPGTAQLWSYGGMMSTSGAATGYAMASHAVLDLALRTMNAMGRPTELIASHNFSQALVPNAPAIDGKTYYSASWPPPSIESHSWFTPDGLYMFLYAESFTAPPGLWRFNVTNFSWTTTGFDHLSFSGRYPAGTDNYTSSVPMPGVADVMNHPGARQGFARASYTPVGATETDTRFCIYSGHQFYFTSRGDDFNTDLWCLYTSGTTDPKWRQMSGMAAQTAADYFPVMGDPGEFGASFNPGCRVGAAMTFSRDGRFLYLFGGSMHGPSGTTQFPKPALMNDLWVFSFANNQWAYLTGSRTWATAGSASAQNIMLVPGAASRLQRPGARVHASMTTDDQGLVYVAYGLMVSANSGPGDGMDSAIFAVFGEQLFNSSWVAPTDAAFAPASHTVGYEHAPWIWMKNPNTGAAAPEGLVWSATPETGRIGATLFFGPNAMNTDATAKTTPTGTLMRTAGGYYHSGKTRTYGGTTGFPYFDFSHVGSAHALPSVVAVTSPCARNPCLNGGVCSNCATATCAAEDSRLFPGVGPLSYRCLCPAGWFGQHCTVQRELYKPLSAAPALPCPAPATYASSLKEPCTCPSDGTTAGTLCSPLVVTSLIDDKGEIREGAVRFFAASTSVQALPLLTARALGVPTGSTVTFTAGGAVKEDFTVLTGAIVAHVPALRASVPIQDEPATGNEVPVLSGTATYTGQMMGASMVFYGAENCLFIYGGIVSDGLNQRDYFERVWRVPVAANTLGLRPTLLTPAERYLLVRPAAFFTDLSLVSVTGTGHAYRTNPIKYPTGGPGARSHHSAVLLRDAFNIDWVYVYGGQLPSSLDATKLAFRADMWRHPATSTSSGTVDWQYVGCSIANDYLSELVVRNASFSMTSFCPPARSRASLVNANGMLVLSGGVGANGPLDDVWRFDPAAETWTLIAGESYKASPSTLTQHVTPRFTGDASTDTIGTRYDHACDALSGSSTVVCHGGFTARDAYVDFYRRIESLELSRDLHFSKVPADALYYPFRAMGSFEESKLGTFVPLDALLQAGLGIGMTVRAVTFYMARPVDSETLWTMEARVGFIPVTDLTLETPLTDIPIPTSSQAQTLSSTSSFGDRGQWFTLDQFDAWTLAAEHVGVIVMLQTQQITGNIVEESLAFSSVGVDATGDVFTTFSTARTKPTHFALINTTAYETNLVPQMRFSTLPAASVQGHAATSDVFTIDSAVAASTITQVAGPPTTRVAPSVAAGLISVRTTPRLAVHAGDPVLEDLELGHASIFSSLSEADPDGSAPSSMRLMSSTLPAVGGHALTLLPPYVAGAVPRFSLYGGRWSIETAWNGATDAASAIDKLTGFEPFLIRSTTGLTPKTASFTVPSKRVFVAGALPAYSAAVTPISPTPPAPVPQTPRFTPSMTQVQFTFDVATQQPLATTSPSYDNCVLLFDVTTLSPFGSGPVCTWTSPTVFMLTLGVSFQARKSTSVKLKGNVVRRGAAVEAGETAYWTAEQTLTIASTYTGAVTPAPVLTGPSVIGPCDALTLSSAGSSNAGGLAFQYTWSVNGSAQQTALANYIESQYGLPSGTTFTATTSPFFLPMLLLPASVIGSIVPANSTALFTLTVTSWFEATASTTILVSRQAMMLPHISIAGSKDVATLPPRNVLVNALITRVGICDDATIRSGITYDWKQIPVLPGDLDEKVEFTGDMASLRIRAYAMKARADPYQFNVTVRDTTVRDTTNFLNYSNTDTVYVTVSASPLRASLTGGDRTHGVASSLALSAAASRDPDIDPTTGSQSKDLSYAWECVNDAVPTMTCFGADTDTVLLESLTSSTEAALLTINSTVLTYFVPSSVTSLRFTVTVSKPSRSAVTATTVVKLVQETPKYELTVASPERAQLLQQNPIVLTALVARKDSAGTTAAAEVNKPLTVWSCDTRNTNLDEAGLILSKSSAPAADNSGRMVHTLTLAGDKLTAGVIYTFRLSLFNESAKVPSQAEIQILPVGALPYELVSGFASFHINTPPRSGVCFPLFASVSMSAAVSDQPFTLQCSGWEDDAEDLPLTYHWYAETKRVLRGEVKSTWVEIGMALPLPTLDATLHAGREEDDYSRVVAVYITDIWGSQTRVEVTVPFTAPAEPAMWRTSPSLYAPLGDSSGVTAADLDVLFELLAPASEVADIATMTQTTLRITDALDTARITAEENASFRGKLLTAVRNMATVLTVSQDARRAVAALDEVARAAAEGSGSSESATTDTNQFNKGTGYSEVAIELLTQLCADGKNLDSDARKQAIQFLITQTSSLASLDAFNGMQTSTADSALVTTQMVIDAFALEISGLNRNMTLTNATTDTTGDGARMIALKNEAASIVNAIAQQMNVLAMGSLAQQAIGQDTAATVKFGGLSVVSQAFTTAQAPSSMAAPMPNSAAETGAAASMARVTMPPSMRSLDANALQFVIAMVEDSAIFHLAGMGVDTYLNGSQSSPLLAFTVFDRALANVSTMIVGEGNSVPAQQPLNDFAGSGASVSSGSLFATFAAAEGEHFTLEVPHPAPTWPDVNFVCEWWHADSTTGVGGKWSTTGCKLVSVSSTNTTTTCQCTHLTLFRVRLDFNNFLPKFNTLDADDFKNLTWTNIKAHPLPLITCGVWFGAYLIFAFIAAMIDRRKDARALRHYHGEWSDPQRKQWDAVTGDTSASLPSSAMLNPDAGVEKMAFTERWIDFSRHLLKHDHLWLSVLLRYDTNAFSSVGRVTAGFVLVLTGYMINALFFGAADGSVGFSTIVTSLISAAILIPVGVLISLLFGRSQQGRLKSAIYGYAEHVAHLHYTNRISEPQYATRNENRMKRNPVVSDEDERMLLHSIAQAGGWTHGPGNALIAENARGTRNERELRNQLRLLVHIDYDLFMVWFRESWSFPLGLRLFGFVLLWAYVIVLVMLILVYGVQLDMDNSDNTMRWLQASAISNVIEIFALKPVSVCIKAFVMLVLSFCFCGGKPKGPASKSTSDDNLTIYNAIEMFSASGAGKGHKHVATDLALDTGAPEHDAVAVTSPTGFITAAPNYDAGNYAALQNSSSHFGSDSYGHSPASPAAVEMMALGGGARAKYEAVHSTPASPVAAAPPQFSAAPPVPAAPYDDESNDYYGDTGDWDETHITAHQPTAMSAVAAPPPPPPVAVAPPPPPPPAAAATTRPPPPPVHATAGEAAAARLSVPPPPLSALHTAQRSQTESMSLDHTPSVPALPAPSGGVPVMGTRSALAYQERVASASVSNGSDGTAGSNASAQSSLRVPMPLPNHIKPEYHNHE